MICMMISCVVYPPGEKKDNEITMNTGIKVVLIIVGLIVGLVAVVVAKIIISGVC